MDSATDQRRPGRVGRRRRRGTIALLVTLGLVVAYMASYYAFSRCGMQDDIVTDDGSRIWAFSGTRMRLHLFSEDAEVRDAGLVDREKWLRILYLPLIKLDKAFGNCHVLETALPATGG